VVLADHQNSPDELVVDSSNVYFSDSGDSSIWQVGTNGGSKLNLASGQTGVSHLDIDDSYVYWIGASSINRVLKGGGTVEPLEPSADAIAVDSAWLYWISGGVFYKAAKAGGSGTALGAPAGLPPISGRLTPRGAKGLVVEAGHKIWSPTQQLYSYLNGSVALTLGRTGDVINARAGVTTIFSGGLETDIPLLPGNLDVSFPYYVASAGQIVQISGAGAGALPMSVVLASPNHIAIGPDGVYWTEGRQVLKAFDCTAVH